MKKFILILFSAFVVWLAYDALADVRTQQRIVVTQSGVVADGHLDHYVSGTSGTLGTFDNLYQDPAGGPYPPLVNNTFLFHNGTHWGARTFTGNPGDVFTIGDDPGILGVGTTDLFFTPGAFRTGTPVAGQVGYWGDGTHLSGDAGMTYNAGTDTLTVTHVSGTDVTVNNVNTTTINGDTFNFNGGGGTLAGGTYTPTASNLSGNMDATPTIYHAYWQRAGNVVHVTGAFVYSCVGGFANTEQTYTINFSLPVASTLGGFGFDLSGMGSLPVGLFDPASSANATSSPVQISGNTTAHTATLTWIALNQDLAGKYVTYTYSYIVE